VSDKDNQDATTNDLTLDAFYDQASTRIRHVMHNGEPYYAMIDVIVLLTSSAAPQQYWRDTKRRMAEEMSAEDWAQTQEKILPLKMEAVDGKQRLTDSANEETLLRIIESIPSPKAEPFKRWLAKVGHERLQEMENPELAADRMRRDYRRLGYSDEWIDRRLQGIMVRDELTQEWHVRGAQEGREFAVLTDTIHQGTFDVSNAQHKAIKHVGGKQNLRDSMTTMELLLTALAEETAKELHQVHDSQGFGELRDDTSEAGEVGGAARRDIEARTGRPVVSSENYKTLRQGRQCELQPPLFAGDQLGDNNDE
jgi:DNA-damage-inducible protein D